MEKKKNCVEIAGKETGASPAPHKASLLQSSRFATGLLNTQHSALSTQHSALSTQHSTQHSALSTQH